MVKHGKHDLDPVGCGNTRTLKAKCEIGFITNVDKYLSRDGIEKECREAIALLFGESMFHDMTSSYGNGIELHYDCTEFGHDGQSDIKIKLKTGKK